MGTSKIGDRKHAQKYFKRAQKYFRELEVS